MLPKGYGQALAALRRKHRVTRRAWAKRADVHEQTVGRAIKEAGGTKEETVQALVEALGESYDDFVRGLAHPSARQPSSPLTTAERPAHSEVPARLQSTAQFTGPGEGRDMPWDTLVRRIDSDVFSALIEIPIDRQRELLHEVIGPEAAKAMAEKYGAQPPEKPHKK